MNQSEARSSSCSLPLIINGGRRMQKMIDIVVKAEDIDHLGHMNYMKYLFYLEKGVINWYEMVGIGRKVLDDKGLGTVLIQFDVSYKQEARLGDQLKIITSLTHVGNKSFIVHQEIYNQEEQLLTKCKKVFVMFNTRTRKGIPVVQEIAQFALQLNKENTL